ncbi:hypothetical protein K466DRAFT_533121 [Polyporus arcularius HHB13444]|uniref:DUF6533 domain-containing protein n=1 Tax=Polyporus arcularius HHB13444 TaxID=1314778 RepID=A0A5C3NRW2_9APHY|nr:hypothetical protein K466DRAFT_533121 [Polyporus arcularius HHB13444]
MSDVHFISPVAVGEMLDAAFMPQGYYVELGCIALIIYEHLLTLASERRAIWDRPWSIPTILFLLNRYLLLLFALAVFLWGFVPWQTDSVCRFPAILQVITPMAIMAVTMVFMALRIHAINNHRWYWTIMLILLGSVEIPPNIVLLTQSQYVAIRPSGLPYGGCAEASYEEDRLDKPVWKRVLVAVSISSFIANVLVVGITWYRTLGLVLAARKVNMRTSLGYYLLRDGTTYFLTGIILNTIIVYIQLKKAVSLSLVAITLQSIFMSRFIINLRTAPIGSSLTFPSVAVGSASESSRMTELRFSPSAFDNLGAPLDVEGANDSEHENGYLEIEEDDDEGTSHGPGAVGEYHAVPEEEEDSV